MLQVSVTIIIRNCSLYQNKPATTA